MSVIETLKKIEYQNLPQFLEDINKNYAIIQNSPLFKGVPGDEGDQGIPGLRGIRGIKFIFVSLPKFQTIFPGELSASSQIDVNYVNTKLLNFDNKQKLLQALEVTELVDKDVIVLTNTIILSYDLANDSFINTGISFNEQANLVNNIQQQIENYVQYYIGINQTINNLSNVFEGFSTLAKNYSDTNNVYVTSNLTASSVYSPFIPGFNSNIGVPMNNHKYFGFSDSQFPLNNNGTIVFGSVKKYYNLLMNTISTDDTQTLTSDYAPGVGNIPSAVFLQDTEKSGILFGYKSRQNLKRFGSIFKNNIHEVVIKSDSGTNPSEYSELKIHREYLKFEKLVQFGNDLEVSRDLSVFADINNRFLKTGKFTVGADSTNNFNNGVVEIGRESNVINPPIIPTLVKNLADYEMYKTYISRVLVTDGTGLVSKNYALETATLPNDALVGLNSLPESINNPNNILTSYYFAYLCRKLNAVSTYVNGNYWRKNQYYTGEIPDLWLSGKLKADGDTNLSNMVITDSTTNPLTPTLKLGGNIQEITTKKIKYNYFPNNVLVTENGFVSNQYNMENHTLNLTELDFGVPLEIWTESKYNVISTKYYAHLAKKINGIAVGLAENYWTKAEFESGVIPSLVLNTGLQVNGGVSFIPNGNMVFNVNPLNGTLTLGNAVYGNTTINSYYMVLSQFAGNMLYVNPDGTLSHDYTLELNNFNEPEVDGNTPISDIVANPTTTSIARGYHIRWLGRKINNLMTWLTDNVWYKPQWLTGEIPTLLTNTFIGTNGDFRAGDVNNPNLSSIGDDTKVGKVGGVTEINGTTLKLNGRPDIVVVTDSNGDVTNNYSVETIYPHSGPGTGGMLDAEIYADYWIKAAQPQTFQDYPTSPNKIVRSFYIGWLVSHLKAIRTLIFDRPTYAELGLAVPNGSIYYWNNAFGPIPAGWVICDGRWIPGIPQRTPDIINKFVKGSTTPNIVGGNINNQLFLTVPQLPAHNHYMNDHTHGFVDWYYAENWANWGLAGSSEGVDSDNAPYSYNKTTNPGGAGFTNNTGTGAAINIEPHNVTLIPIMKFWDGQGIMPVVTLPAWSTITGITTVPNTLKVNLTLTILDTTVTNCEILGSVDGGTTWNVLKVLTTVTSTILNVDIPSIGNWKFKMRATSGDSFTTTGEFSNIFDYDVFVPWARLLPHHTINALDIELNWFVNDNTVTSMTLMRSTDNINFIDIQTVTLVGQTSIFDTVPVEDEYYYKLRANDGNPITSATPVDNISNTNSYNIVGAPLGFATIGDMMIEFDDAWFQSHGVSRSIIDVYTAKHDATVTSVRLEIFNTTTNAWTTFITTMSYTTPNCSGTKAGIYSTGRFRLKALNGTSINTYTPEFEIQ